MREVIGLQWTKLGQDFVKLPFPVLVFLLEDGPEAETVPVLHRAGAVSSNSHQMRV